MCVRSANRITWTPPRRDKLQGAQNTAAGGISESDEV